jgi:membrane protease YdiL (CAAX protease family)
MDYSPAEPLTEAPVPPPVAREPFWGYVDLALFIGLLSAFFLVIIVIIMFAAAVNPHLSEQQTVLILPVNLAAYLSVYGAFWIVLKVRYGKPVFPSLGWRRPHALSLSVAIFGGVALMFLVELLAAAMHTPKVKTPLDEIGNSPVLLVLFGIMAVAIAPVFEEMLFRGFIQPLLSRTFGLAIGIGVTAVSFGALHAFQYQLVWQYVVAVSVVGVALGYMRARTNSLIPSTVMHGCYNMMFIIALAISSYNKK